MNETSQFLHAAQHGEADTVAAQVRRYPELSRAAGEYNKTALHWAAESDYIDVARVLVDSGADIEARTSWGASPLDWAAVMGSGRVADLLLSRGASGLTLITAAALGKLSEVKSNLESVDDLSAHRRRDAPDQPSDQWPADTAHMTADVPSDALYASARNGHTAVVEYLLARGANVDAKGFFGGSALHWAAINGHTETVRLLVAKGADLNLRDAQFNATPEEWALEGGHNDIAEMLKDGG